MIQVLKDWNWILRTGLSSNNIGGVEVERFKLFFQLFSYFSSFSVIFLATFFLWFWWCSSPGLAVWRPHDSACVPSTHALSHPDAHFSMVGTRGTPPRVSNNNTNPNPNNSPNPNPNNSPNPNPYTNPKLTVKVETHRTRFGKAARFFSFHSQISLLLI